MSRTVVRIRSDFKGLEQALVTDAADAITMVAEEVMTDSKLNYVPVRLGFLRMSGFVRPTQIVGTRATVTLGYGGPTAIGKNVTYALKVHEAPPTYGQGKNKYLTRPLYSIVPSLPQFIATFMAAKLQARAGVK